MRYDANFNNPALPPDLSYSEQIIALPGFRSWWRIGPGCTLEAGDISLVPAMGGASTATLGQGTADRRPTYADGAMGMWPGADFDGSNDVLLASALPYTKDGTFTWAAVCDVSTAAAAQDIAALFSVTGQSTRLTINENGYPQFQHGNGTVTLAQDMRNRKLLLIGSSNGSQIKLRANGVDATPGATNNAQTATFMTIGAANTLGTLLPATMRLSDFWVLQADVLSDPDAAAIFEGYAASAYRVEIA